MVAYQDTQDMPTVAKLSDMKPKE